MRLQFKEITRGDGKVYLRLLAQDMPESARIRATSTTETGSLLPAMVQHIGPGADADIYAVVVAIMSCTQIVQAVAYEDDLVLANTSVTLEPRRVAFESKRNTLLKGAEVAQVRNCDKPVSSATTFIAPELLVVDQPDGTAPEDAFNIIRWLGSTICTSKQDGKAPVEISVYNDQGECLRTPQDVIVLEDKVAPHTEYSAQLVRTILFSIRVPRVPLFVWVHYPQGQLPDGIYALEKPRLEELIAGFHHRTMNAAAHPDYEQWLFLHRPVPRDLDAQRLQSQTFEIRPCFSIIVPLYKTPIDFFSEMLDSVLDQTYDRFELVLVNASPEDTQLAEAVDAARKRDGRVKVATLSENRGIVGNTNAGIQEATGDFLCFMDHDDFIEPDLLFEYTKAINEYPDTDLLYCDEDKYRDGALSGPYFKPDWSPDLLTCVNYVTHLLCVRKSIVDELEPAGPEFEGAQDYHMTFRVSEKARHVHHVPRVMYHWRVHEQSSASSIDAKPYALEAGTRAIQSHLDRCGIQGTAKVFNERAVRYWVDYTDVDQPPVSIIIPNKDSVAVLACCIDSIYEKTTYTNYEIVVVENNSEQAETFNYYQQIESAHENLRVVKCECEWNFSKVMNFGVEQAQHDYLLLLNNDTEVITPNWIQQMMGPCLRDEVGMVGAKLYYADDLIQHAGVLVGEQGANHMNHLLARSTRGYFFTAQLSLNLSAVTAACVLVKRSVFDEVGGFDIEYPVEYNDVDLCLKVREAGYLVVFTPFAELYHYESLTRGTGGGYNADLRFLKAKVRLKERWLEYALKGDPYANPNLIDLPKYHTLLWI